MEHRTWSELGRGQRWGIAVSGAVQAAMAAWAWHDLAHRPAEQVNGRKSVWAAVIAVNFVGPVVYWRWGRARP